MKLAFGILVFIWLLCGLVGAWRLEGRHDMRLKWIVRGPFTLAKAFDEYPVNYPGPD